MAKKEKKEKQQKIDLSPLKGFFIIIGTLALLLALLSYAYGTAHNWMGMLGDTFGKWLHALFGLGSYAICIFLGWAGWRRLFFKPISRPWIKIGCVAILVVSLGMLLSLLENAFPAFGNFLRQLFYPALTIKKLRPHLGGAPAAYLYQDLPGFNLYLLLNHLGVLILFGTTLIASFFYLAKIHPATLLLNFWRWFAARKERNFEDEEPLFAAAANNEPRRPENDPMRMVKLKTSTTPDLLAIQPETQLKERPSLSRKEVVHEIQMGAEPPAPTPNHQPPVPKKTKREAAVEAQRVYNGDFGNYALPPPTLLSNPKKIDQNLLKKDLRRQAEVLEETLLSFGIEAKVGQINCGPTISSFEVHPAIGVKVQKIKTLENDIALNMEAKSLRIIAPIPGKAAVGIEVPNPQSQEVSFKEMLLAYQQGGKKLHIPILLGKAVNGDNVMSDLTKMPHCIIAGATGSGKSVCINTIIMSIALNAKPDEIKLVMVDPKKVELTPYSRLPHMLSPVITEPQGATAALNWLVKEMEIRYEILKLVGQRNIDGFNNRPPNKEFEKSLERNIPDKMPYIVGIIDELADLMMVASSDIETPIARIAQMARAVGIHLILATQRPSREVITGLIKANFPTRISFKVASRVNSQIVLDENGAENLLGNGDMLFLPPGSSHLIRAQGAFIRDEDINAVIKFICDQAPPNYVIESFDRMGYSLSEESGGDDLPQDELYEEAKATILSTGNASTTFLQRKLKVGYARAASLIDMLEAKGVVGPAEGAKPRKILLKLMKGDEEDEGEEGQ